MSNVLLAPSPRFQLIGVAAALATSVTSGAANTKGTWATIGTADFDWDGFFLTLFGGTGSSRSCLLDIGIGATPDFLLKDLIFHTSTYHNTFKIPIKVPIGATVKARHQSVAASNALVVSIVGGRENQFGTPGFNGAEQIPGIDAASCPNSAVTETGTTPTTWVPLITSAQRNYRAILPQLSPAGDTTRTGGSVQVDLAKGAAGIEQPFLSYWSRSDSIPNLGNMPVLPAAIPAGERFSYRVTGSAAGLTDSIALGVLGFW